MLTMIISIVEKVLILCYGITKRHTAMTKYILVTFPEIQDFMEHPRFGECIFCESIEGHPVESSTYAVPEDLYEEVYREHLTHYYKEED